MVDWNADSMYVTTDPDIGRGPYPEPDDIIDEAFNFGEAKYKVGTKLKVNRAITMTSGSRLSIGEIITIIGISSEWSVENIGANNVYTFKEYADEKLSDIFIEDESNFTKVLDKITNWKERIKWKLK